MDARRVRWARWAHVLGNGPIGGGADQLLLEVHAEPIDGMEFDAFGPKGWAYPADPTDSRAWRDEYAVRSLSKRRSQLCIG